MARIEIQWKGETLVIREDQAFAAAEAVEEVFTITDIARMEKSFNTTKLSRAFAALVTFAGGQATKEEVRESIMAAIHGGESADAVLGQVFNSLVAILMDGAPDEGATPAGKPKKKRAKGSRKPAS